MLNSKSMEDIHSLTVFMFYNKKILLLNLGELFILMEKGCCKNLKMVEKKNVEVFITHKEETLGFREASGNFQKAKKLYPLNIGSLNI